MTASVLASNLLATRDCGPTGFRRFSMNADMPPPARVLRTAWGQGDGVQGIGRGSGWLAHGTTAGWDHRRSYARDDRMVSAGIVAEVLAAQSAGLGAGSHRGWSGRRRDTDRISAPAHRADVVRAGVDGRTGGDAYVVELKQWSQAELYEVSASCAPRWLRAIRPGMSAGFC